ncbi:MAG TPA: ATP-dependent DNA ligase [Acidothermaceae bacterium]
MLLADLVAVSGAVAATRSRSAKVALIAACLRAAHPAEREIAAAYLSGELRQRRTGIGWSALRDLATNSAGPSLALIEVDAAFSRIAAQTGAGSQNRRRAELVALFESASTEAERRFLAALVAGELRQGALDGVMVDAIANAAEVPLADVRRAFMLRGSLWAVAAIALTDGLDGLRAITFEVNRPVQPMLARSAPSIVEALAQISPAALEWKIDGIRVQMHRDGTTTRVFTRTLDDITDRVPELVAVMNAIPADSIVLDGEAVALDAGDRPRPFQETAARTSSRVDVEALQSSTPLSVFVFDALYLDGESLLDRPATERQAIVDQLVPQRQRTPRIVTDDPAVAAEFFAAAIALGHEGVIVKSLVAPYEAGRRGDGWIKVKPRHTLDLVVLAAEWGHGRRQGWLSNLHLGARDNAGGFVMLGKTFKGMTDEMLRWQTEQFLRLETHRDASTVYLRPELVVEIAFDGVQSSPRYPGRVALRFARVLRYRPDKRAGDADDIEAVRAI